MQHVNCIFKLNRINCAKRISSMIFYNLHNSWPFAFPRFGIWMFSSELGDAQGHAHFILNLFWKAEQILFGRSYPEKRLLAWIYPRSRHSDISQIRDERKCTMETLPSSG